MSSRKEKRNYRDSIFIAEAKLQSIIGDRMRQLRDIWNDVGMDEVQRSDRIDTVIAHVDTLFSEMCTEELEMAHALINQIEEYKITIAELCVHLHKPAFEVANFMTKIELSNSLQAKLEVLKEEKERRMADYCRLRDDDIEICDSLDIVAYSIAPNEVPTEEQMDELKRHVEQNRRVRDSRRARMKELKTTVVRIMLKLNMTPKSDIERDIVAEHVVALPLSKEFLHRAESLLTRLEGEYEKYLESIRQRVGEVKNELLSWWDRCHVDEDRKNSFQHIDEENFDEIALVRYNDEIAVWRKYYEERQELLDKVQMWQSLWKEKLDYEEKDKDGNRYNNRGGALLQEEKERKKLEKRLPLVRSEIHALVKQWHKGHPVEPILLEGLPVLQRLDAIETEHIERKEQEKQEKLKAKKQQLEVERLYGAAPVTPSKKRNITAMRRGGNNSPIQMKDTFAGACTSRYVHSSLIPAARSPIISGSNLPPKASKLPPGLPKPPISRPNPMKRRAADENRMAVPLHPLNRHDGSAATTASSGSYGDFVQEIREKGLEGQSSFIVIPTPTPSKLFKS